MKKEVEIDGKKMVMVANARVPRIYRNEFNRDLLLDMQSLTQGMKDTMTTGENFPIELLTIFENVAWVFLKEGGNDVGNSPDEFLESVEMLSIYYILPQIIELWQLNTKQTSTPSRKK